MKNIQILLVLPSCAIHPILCCIFLLLSTAAENFLIAIMSIYTGNIFLYLRLGLMLLLQAFSIPYPTSTSQKILCRFPIYWRTPTPPGNLFLQWAAFPLQQQYTTLPSLMHSFPPGIAPHKIHLKSWLCESTLSFTFHPGLALQCSVQCPICTGASKTSIPRRTTFMKDAAFTTYIFYQYYLFLCNVKPQVRFWVFQDALYVQHQRVWIIPHFADEVMLSILPDPTSPDSYTISLTLGWWALTANIFAHILCPITVVLYAKISLRQLVKIHTALE